MIRAHRVNATAQDDASLVSGWSVAPNVAYVLRLLPGASSCGVLLYSVDNVLIATGAALSGTDQPCALIPQTGQTVGMVDEDLGWHLLITTTGTESQREIRIGPAVDLPDEIHPVYGDDGMALARATAAIDTAAHYIDDVAVTCPLGLGAGLGDVVSVPVDGVAVVGQAESVTWTGTPDGTSEQAVIRRHVAIAPEPYVEPLPVVPPVVVDDAGTTDAITAISGNVLTNDDPGLTVVAVNGLSGNVGVAVDGSNGGAFTVDSEGAWTFDPDGDFAALAGADTADTSVAYYASDGVSEAAATLTITVTSASATPQFSDLVMSANPAFFWMFDETTGSIAVDASGNGNNGTYAVSVALSQPPLISGSEYGCKINAANSIVGPYLVASTAISVFVPIKINGAPSKNVDIIGFTRYGYYAPWMLIINATTGYIRLLQTYLSVSSGRIDITTSANVCDNNVHIIGYTWDKNGDKKARIYVDGQVALESTPWDRTIWAGATEHKITMASSMDVLVDDTALYMTCLTPEQVLAQYNASIM